MRDPSDSGRLGELLAGAIGARVTQGEVAVGHAGERLDENGRLNEPNLEQEVHKTSTRF